jgi:hypothetical protein
MVRYVGSPYQTSLSEAGQTKFLYCMSYLPSNDTVNESFSDGPHAKDRLVWKEEQRVPIHVGMKYFKVFPHYYKCFVKLQILTYIIIGINK